MIAKNEASLIVRLASRARALDAAKDESVFSCRVCVPFRHLCTRATLMLSLVVAATPVYARRAPRRASRRRALPTSARKNPSPDVASSAKYSMRTTATIVHAMTKAMPARKKMD